jgi:BlaI family penicillinase repressor
MTASHVTLSRRERQIMDVLYRKGRATAAEVLEHLADPPGYSSIRALLRILEEKGHARHEMDGTKYVFIPSVHRDAAKRSAIRHLVRTFFEGSPELAVAALLDLSSPGLSDEEVVRMTTLIQKSRNGRKR